MVPKEHKTGVVSLPNCFNGIMPGGSHGHVALYIRPNSGSKELPIFRDIRPMFPFANFAKSIRCLDCRISFSTCLNLAKRQIAGMDFPELPSSYGKRGCFYSMVMYILGYLPVKHALLPIIHYSLFMAQEKSVC